MQIDNDGAHIIIDFLGDNLEPPPLLKLIPFRCLKPRRKGEPMGRGSLVAKTGVCCFSTGWGDVDSKNAEDHARYCLDVIEPLLPEIRKIIASQQLHFEVLLFEGTRPGEFFSDISVDVLKKYKTLGIPFSPDPSRPPV